MKIDHDAIDQLIDYLLDCALRSPVTPAVFKEACLRLQKAGLSLLRVNMSWTTLHPTIEALSMIWWKDRAFDDITPFLHTEEDSQEWLNSPGYHVVSNEIERLDVRLDQDKLPYPFPMLRDLKNAGGTHYIIRLFEFSDPGEHTHENDGMILSFLSDRQGGFTDEEAQTLKRVERYFAIALKVALRERIALNTLTAYLGQNAAARVLTGSIRLGDGEHIPAAIWYSDLRNSTVLGDTLPGPELLQSLNDYFSATAGSVIEHGGEVLRFVGDAVLAIFPSEDQSLKSACDKATQAARDAIKRLRDINDLRRHQDKAPLAFGLGLHTGELMFGNIGIPERMDFSVTGPEANETARIESMTKELSCPILASRDFAQHSPESWTSLGEYPLRGVKRSIELFALK
ncbi:adenylate/guanylate cyclase domain-containing protein [Terasakiella pusilla]|uniref:adenylate/guanylate cyclase domain-containing protein n=1 Tax=Terasakiella pusilla TaxID=64973 RepID=UPI003AA9046E